MQDLFDKLDDKAKFQWLYNEIERTNDERRAFMRTIFIGVWSGLGGLATVVLPYVPAIIEGWISK